MKDKIINNMELNVLNIISPVESLNALRRRRLTREEGTAVGFDISLPFQFCLTRLACDSVRDNTSYEDG